MVSFFEEIIRFLNQEKIPYMLTGSMAIGIYTLGRSTHDFDFIVQLKKESVAKITEHFRKGYYCSEDAVRDAIDRKGMFNIIDHGSMFKADFFILNDADEYQQSEFGRRTRVDLLGTQTDVVSAEDLLLSKLIWIQQLQSGRQMEDIAALTKVPTLDWDYIRLWIAKLKLTTFGLL